MQYTCSAASERMERDVAKMIQVGIVNIATIPFDKYTPSLLKQVLLSSASYTVSIVGKNFLVEIKVNVSQHLALNRYRECTKYVGYPPRNVCGGWSNRVKDSP